MFRRLLSLGLGALSLALSLGCPASTPVPEPVPRPAPPAPPPTGTVEPAPGKVDSGAKGSFTPASADESAALVTANNAFAAALYGELAGNHSGNFAVSPLSVSLALGMTYAGAAGDTAAEMKKALHFTLAGDATHRAFGTMLRSFAPKADAKYELRIANRLFGAQQVAFAQPYLDVTADHYLAPLEKLDFLGQAEPSRRRINDWVAEQTAKKIENLLPEGSIQPSTAMVLANAVYFNGTWVEKFDEKATAPGPFHAASGAVKAPMMHIERRFGYGEADGVKLLSMGYLGSDIGFTVILPNEKDGLAAVEREVVAGKLGAWLGQIGSAKVKLTMPKFKLAGAVLSLKAALTSLGMPAAFDEARADFSGMAAPGGGPKLVIGDVFHKAYVDLHERGTEAAAATGVMMQITSMPAPSVPKELVVDHPFLFLIHDRGTGAILFMGRVSDPTKPT